MFKALSNIKSNQHIKYVLVTGHTDDFTIFEEYNPGGFGHFKYTFEGFKNNPIETLKEKIDPNFPVLQYRQSNLYDISSIIDL